MSCVGKRKVDDYENLESRALSTPRTSKLRIDEATTEESPNNSGPCGHDDTRKSPSTSYYSTQVSCVGKKRGDDYESLESRALSTPRACKPRIDEATTGESPSHSGPRGHDDTRKSPSNFRHEKNGRQSRSPAPTCGRMVDRQVFVRNRPEGMSDLHFVALLNNAMKNVNLCPKHINPIFRCDQVNHSKLYVMEAESEHMAGKILNLNGLFVPGGKLPIEIFRHSRYNGPPEKWKSWEEVKSQAQLTSPRSSLATSRKPSRSHSDEDTNKPPRRIKSHHRDDDTYKSSRSTSSRREEDTYESSRRSRSRVDEGNYKSSRRSSSHCTESPRRYRSHYRDDDTYESSRIPGRRREEDTYESSRRSRSQVDEDTYESSRRSRSHRDDDNLESPSKRSRPCRVDENDKSSRKNEVPGRRDENTYETRSPSSSELSNQNKINGELLVRNNKLNTLVGQETQKGLDRGEAKAGFFSREGCQHDITTARGRQLAYSQPQKLFVGSINPKTRKDDLLAFLGHAIIQGRLSLYPGSPITMCKMQYGPTKTGDKYAILEVRTEEEAQNLLHLNGIPLMGRGLKVHRSGIANRRRNGDYNPLNWHALQNQLNREKDLSGNAPRISFKVAPNFGGDYEDHSGQRKPDIERDPIETVDVISRRTSEARKPLVTGTPHENSRSTISAPNTTVEVSAVTATNTNDTKTTPVPDEAKKTSESTATLGIIDREESTTVEHQLGEYTSEKRIPDTTKEELQKAREELDRMMKEAEVLRINQYLEIRVREENQRVEEKQKKYEDLMIEYTFLGKDFRQASNSLLEATAKQKELQEAMMSARETREEAERAYGKEKVARKRIERDLEQTLVSWKKEVEELEGKIK